MTALSAARSTLRRGDKLFNEMFMPGMEASAVGYPGGMAAINLAGNCVPASADATLKVIGVFEPPHGAYTPDNTGGAAGAIKTDVRKGVFRLNNGTAGDAITALDIEQPCYVIDDNTVGRTDSNGTRPRAGIVEEVDASGQIWVRIGVPGVSIDLSLQRAFKARAVCTSIAAIAGGSSGTDTLTANANGALANQDNLTLAVGDVMIIPEGTTNLPAAKDAGPWMVSNAGSASTKFVLTRPSWWKTGTPILPGQVIEVGGEGQLFPGSSWKAMAAVSKVVGTDAPSLYPKHFKKTITLAAGTYTIGAGGGGEALLLFSTTLSMVVVTRNTPNTSTATTGGYASAAGTRVAGVVGTAAVVVQAQVAAGTINNADVSTLDVLITNW